MLLLIAIWVVTFMFFRPRRLKWSVRFSARLTRTDGVSDVANLLRAFFILFGWGVPAE